MATELWLSTRSADDILRDVHYASPFTLLSFFLIAFTVHSIATASDDTDVAPSQDQTGPGGKPLPKKIKPKEDVLDFSPARKLLFNWTQVGVILTLVANAVVVIVRALVDREDNWWCGQAVAVSSLVTCNCQICRSLTAGLPDLHSRLLLRLLALSYLLGGH